MLYYAFTYPSSTAEMYDKMTSVIKRASHLLNTSIISA